MPRGVSRARELVAKARQEALQAVAAYNNPLATFKSGTYVVLMHLAWTALFHAISWKGKIKPWYRQRDSNRFKRIDGRPKTWDLKKCVRQYWAERDDAVRQNLQFFIGLRNLIEHADAPEIDLDIFGECQALLINFENFLTEQFGERFALNTNLAFSLQFSRGRDPKAREAMRRLLAAPAHADIKTYVTDFRSSLSPDVLGDMAYSYKVFLIPMLANHRSEDALAIEFVHYDPDQADDYDRTVALIKPRTVAVVSKGKLKPSHVLPLVVAKIAPRVFNMDTHTRAWKYWKVRPPADSPNPTDCKTKYCQYDEPHGDYLYTDDWVDLLATELGDDAKYEEVRSYRPDAASSTQPATA